jgi:hypothetical protein
LTYKVQKIKKGNETIIEDACVECIIYHSTQDTCNCKCHIENRQSVEEIFEEAGAIGDMLEKTMGSERFNAALDKINKERESKN